MVLQQHLGVVTGFSTILADTHPWLIAWYQQQQQGIS